MTGENTSPVQYFGLQAVGNNVVNVAELNDVGLQVVNKAGERVGIFRAILRLFGLYISAIVFLLGFIWALFDRRRQGWHDKFGGTFVLYAWPAVPEENFLNEQVTAEMEESGLIR